MGATSLESKVIVTYHIATSKAASCISKFSDSVCVYISVCVQKGLFYYFSNECLHKTFLQIVANNVNGCRRNFENKMQ